MILFRMAVTKNLPIFPVSFFSLFSLTIMLFVILPLLLLTSLACSTGADSLGATQPLSQNLDRPLLNVSQVQNVIPTSNLSDVLTLPIPLPYGFSVPGTQTHLRLGFGLPRHRLDPMSMAGLIAVIQHAIVEGIDRDGEEAYPGLDMIADRQKFGWTLGDGFYFVIRSTKNTGRYFTWGQLRNVVEGLRLFLIVGERCYATVFNFWDGPGWWWKNPLGSGGFGVEKDGEVESAN